MAGIRTPEHVSEMQKVLPDAFEQFAKTMRRLEERYRDVQDIEFTRRGRRLYLLQTRSAKRTAAAALKSAVDIVEEGVSRARTPVARIDAGQLDQLLHPMIDPPRASVDMIAQGLNESPGAAYGKIVFDADTAAERGWNGDDVILVRWETTPDDIHGMIAAKGILAAHGGMTSHAAVVARGMGQPCVAGCEALTVDVKAKKASLNGHELGEDDLLTIDSGTGRVILGAVPSSRPRSTRTSRRFSAGPTICTGSRFARTRTRPRTPPRRASSAPGHRSLPNPAHVHGRRPANGVRAMIMASGEEERRRALERLLPLQQSDFEGMFEAMAGLPVTIRLLDPPLHEPCRRSTRPPTSGCGSGSRAPRGQPDARDTGLPPRSHVAEIYECRYERSPRRPSRSRSNRRSAARRDDASRSSGSAKNCTGSVR